jgi:hypothetical protein
MALSYVIDHCQLVIANYFAGKDSQTSCATIGNDQLAMGNWSATLAST